MSITRAGGRSAIVRAKVLAAASELVATQGLRNVTLPEIAQRAGVAGTSVYRRWGDINSLLLDMSVERLAQKFPVPDEGSIKKDLELWGERIALGLNSTEEAKFFRILLATSELEPEQRMKALAPRLEQLEAMVQRSRSRGEKAPSVDEIFDYIISPLYMRALLGRPVDRSLANQLVHRLLNA